MRASDAHSRAKNIESCDAALNGMLGTLKDV